MIDGDSRSLKAGGPVAIGGVGGSGTRVLAWMLGELAFEIGQDLNGALDNLWFTLLFKHLGVRSLDEGVLRTRYRQFRNRMQDGVVQPPVSPEEIEALTGADRAGQHLRPWLEGRIASFRAPGCRPGVRRWGWKEPNTHVVIDLLLRFDESLHYIHLWRHPLYMSRSRNRNQLRLWGPGVLGSAYSDDQKGALAYWVRVHSRILRLAKEFPGRIALLSYDDLCRNPKDVVPSVLRLLSIEPSPELVSRLADGIAPPRPSEGTSSELSGYDPHDLAFLRQHGLL